MCEFACAHTLFVSRYVCNPAVPAPLCFLPLSLSPSCAASQRLMDEANAEEQKVESALSIGSGSGRLSTVPTGERDTLRSRAWEYVGVGVDVLARCVHMSDCNTQRRIALTDTQRESLMKHDIHMVNRM